MNAALLSPDPAAARPSGKRRLFKAALCAGAAVLMIFGAKRGADYLVLREIRARAPQVAAGLKMDPPENRGAYVIQKFSYESAPGQKVPVTAVLPAADGRRHPTIIFLYGIGMKMKLYDEVSEAVTRAGFALVIPEQYGRGERAGVKSKGVEKFLDVRRRIVLTILETRRLADELSGLPGVDPERIYLWGASFGAMTGCPAMAYDQRFKAAVFTVAAGDLQRIVRDSPYIRKKSIFSWEKAAAPLIAEIFRPFDPLLHVGRIAPRPLLFQNTLHDELLPVSAVQALYAAAGQPKDIRWYESPHDRPVRKAIEDAVRDGLAWLQEQDRALAK